MRALIIVLVALPVVVWAAGCGDDEPRKGGEPPARTAPGGGDEQVAEAERLTGVKVPDGARDVRARVNAGIDASAGLRFTADADAAQAAVEGAKLKGLEDPDPSLYEAVWRELGRPADLRDAVVVEENDGTGLRVVIYGRDPGGDGTTVFAYASRN